MSKSRFSKAHYGGVGQAVRYSGRVRVACSYRDNANDYVCHISVGGKRCCTEYVGGAVSHGIAVDSAEAFDGAARTAISFAMFEHKLDDSDVNFDDSGVKVSRRK